MRRRILRGPSKAKEQKSEVHRRRFTSRITRAEQPHRVATVAANWSQPDQRHYAGSIVGLRRVAQQRGRFKV